MIKINQMKKLFLILPFLIFSCSSDDNADESDVNELIGSWVLNSKTQDGVELTWPSYICSVGNETITFYDDFTFDFVGYHSSVAGDCEINTTDIYSGTYSILSNEATLTSDGESESAQYQVIDNQVIFTSPLYVTVYDKL
jgi:hypothetical protein